MLAAVIVLHDKWISGFLKHVVCRLLPTKVRADELNRSTYLHSCIKDVETWIKREENEGIKKELTIANPDSFNFRDVSFLLSLDFFGRGVGDKRVFPNYFMKKSALSYKNLGRETIHSKESKSLEPDQV
ncbi:hypothetical protein VNO77_01903 [Canavalia gladiata]|uniref:Uncharacterized protein n=1 Tax=Canavalia gladiata TaxID=3824 RepID=A0AAN9MX55_CANGL